VIVDDRMTPGVVSHGLVYPISTPPRARPRGARAAAALRERGAEHACG